MDKQTGEIVVARLMSLSEEINQLAEVSINMGKTEEAVQLRRSLAKVMIEIDEMLRMVVRQYPDMNPDKDE